MKHRLIALLILATCGCDGRRRDVDAEQFWAERFWQVDEQTASVAAATASKWINSNLDLEGRKLNEYHYDFCGFSDDSGKKVIYMQYAHKKEKSDLIGADGSIEACDGGFPEYFTLDLSEDGKVVTGHYASPE